ncbi:AAA family ATPase [Streptomyces sp. NPDC017988]|uniref:AAA family ATPase n=1 Tax=Streptomyces sp. NPDC017988 TaxID=3365025 RepID=UPI00379D9C2D
MSGPRARTAPWDILLLGGASGVGKSRAAAQLAAESKAFVVEFDDAVAAVRAITTARGHPDLHHFDGGVSQLSAARVLELQIATARALDPALLGVVSNRLTVDVPAVIEGDYLTPAAAARAMRAGAAAGREVRAVFLHEGDPGQIAANYACREPDEGDQTERAGISAAYSCWLGEQAALHALPVVDARPWATLASRVRQALDHGATGVA